MLLADRGFASHELMAWLESVNWHYALRLKCDVQLHGVKRYPVTVGKLYPAKNEAIESLYLVTAIALLYATTQGMAVQIAGLRTQVNPHWRRGLSYLKIGLRYLRGVVNKGRSLLFPRPLLPQDPQPCFASLKAQEDYYHSILFSRISTITCKI